MGLERDGLCVSIEVRHWFVSIYLDPRRWAFDYHREAPCCKWWLVVGPFEINRVWTDADVYPWGADDAV